MKRPVGNSFSPGGSISLGVTYDMAFFHTYGVMVECVAFHLRWEYEEASSATFLTDSFGQNFDYSDVLLGSRYLQ